MAITPINVRAGSTDLKGLSSDTKPTVSDENHKLVPNQTLFIEIDTGSVYKWMGSGWYPDSTGGAAHVATSSEQSGDYEDNEVDISAANDFDTDIATSLHTITPSSGYDRLLLTLRDMGSSTLVEVRVVFNATNATDAATKLGLAGSRVRLKLGDDFERFFPADGLCTRIDWYTPNTETGASLLNVSGRIA